jgi:hypothetical protein
LINKGWANCFAYYFFQAPRQSYETFRNFKPIDNKTKLVDEVHNNNQSTVNVGECRNTDMAWYR